MALIAAWLMARTVSNGARSNRSLFDETIDLAGASTTALLVSGLIFGSFVDLLPIYASSLGASALICYFVPRLSMPGVIWLTVEVTGLIVTGLWSYLFVSEAALPPAIEPIALLGVAGSVIFLTIGLASRIAREAILTHDLWQMPTQAPAPFSASRQFKVSMHLACYAEPPEVVKETMNRIAALDYDNYEVLVCDNNTKDERLWRPLEDHCAALNARLGVERFRFFHVAPLPGAKAGALNFCLEKMAPDTEIVGVVDADYLSRKDFLSRLVSFFDDPKIAYVQTPHDYRDFDGSEYLSACYWEYMPNNKVDMPGVSEYGGAFTIGTMCLLRAEALRQVGGWAEWCLTEDSEVSVRLRAAGYKGIYIGESFGWGLIPDTFDDYKKQRFRWTAGPVQQLRRHWRHFLPEPFAPAMPGWTKVLEVLRCVSPIQTLFGLLSAIVGALAIGIALATDTMEPVDIPNVSWLLLAIGGATWWIRTKLRYRLAGTTQTRDIISGELARMALTYIVLVGGVAGLSSKPLAWRRTPKFAVQSAEPSPFASTLPETMLGTACLIMTFGVLSASSVIGLEFAMLMAIGLGTLAFRFFCAPYVAAMAIRHVRAEIANTPATTTLIEAREATA